MPERRTRARARSEWSLRPKDAGLEYRQGPATEPGAPVPQPLCRVPDACTSYLFEASPAPAEAQSGAGVDLDHHLPLLLGLGSVVEPAPHRVAPASQQATR